MGKLTKNQKLAAMVAGTARSMGIAVKGDFPGNN